MDKRKLAAAGFGCFLCFMAVCTIIAKGIYTSGLARVRICTPVAKAISHEVRAAGRVFQGQERGIYTEEGLRVAEISVQTGDCFEQGSPLFRIDISDLQRLIAQKELEVEKLYGSLIESEEYSQSEQQTGQITLARAREDYNKAVRDAEKKISRRQQTLSEARKALSEYRQYLEVQKQEDQNGVGNTVGNICSNRDGNKNENISGAGDISGGNADAGENDNTQEQLNVQETLRSLEAAVAAAEQETEDALLEKEDALREAERKIEDAKQAAGGKNYQEKAGRMEIQYQESLLWELKALEETDGWIYAEEGGVVTARNIQVGERTGDNACMRYAADDGGRMLEVSFTGEQLKYVGQGDRVTLRGKDVSGYSWEQEGNIVYLEEQEDGSGTARIPLEGVETAIGQSVDVQLVRYSEDYACCIPVGALYSQTAGGYYVYVAEEQEGILGTEWHIRKVSVNVLEKNDSYAAIESAGITLDSKIVEYSSREIAEGSVVRLNS